MSHQRIIYLIIVFSLSGSVPVYAKTAACERHSELVQQESTFANVAKPAIRPQGAPAYSDVCLSSRWRRPLSPADGHNTFKTAEAFHATRLDWMYSTDPDWIRQCKQAGYNVTISLNSILPDTPGGKTKNRGRQMDKNGDKVTAPWMQGWGAWWGCANNPAWLDILLAHAKLALEGGADGFQLDDPDLNYRTAPWGGCHCEYCEVKATALGFDLQDSTANAAFQKESTTQFIADLRRKINAMAGRDVPFSCNNYEAQWQRFPYRQFEMGMAELPEKFANPYEIYSRLRITRQLRKAQIITFVSRDVLLTQRVIATSYAAGGHMMVPWDVYLESTPNGSIRYFGKPEEYAHLYRFVRDHALYFDGYEDAATLLPDVDESRYAELSPVRFADANEGPAIFVRARPGDDQAPIVVHMVDWQQKKSNPDLLISKNALGWLHKPEIITVQPTRQASNPETCKIRSQGSMWRISYPVAKPWRILVIARRGENPE